MSTPRILALILFVSLCAVPPARAAIDCAPMRSTATNKTTEDTIDTKVNSLFKWLASGEITNAYRNTETDVLSAYPHADCLLVWRSFLYVSCTMIASSKLDDNTKWQR